MALLTLLVAHSLRIGFRHRKLRDWYGRNVQVLLAHPTARKLFGVQLQHLYIASGNNSWFFEQNIIFHAIFVVNIILESLLVGYGGRPGLWDNILCPARLIVNNLLR